MKHWAILKKSLRDSRFSTLLGASALPRNPSPFILLPASRQAGRGEGKFFGGAFTQGGASRRAGLALRYTHITPTGFQFDSLREY